MTHHKFFAYRSFWPELETMRKFHEIGIDEVVFFPSNTMNSLGEPYSKYPSNWLWFDHYDFAPLDRQVADILSVNPDAQFICMIDLNSPMWLVRQLICSNADSFTHLTEAICHPRWIESMERYLNAIYEHCESRYSDRIKSYILASGQTDEWMDFSDGACRKYKFAAYREWCKKQHLECGDDAPTESACNHAEIDGLLRDPQVDREALKYWRFTSEVVVDSILHFANILRPRLRPGVEIGIFYGYIMELTTNFLVSAGHLDYERLLASEAIDYLISPGTYSNRPMGTGGGFMVPNGTVRVYGKNYMHECDQRTHTFNPNLSNAVKLDFLHWPDDASDIAGMKREMALSLIHHTSLWWFDMWGGYYQTDTVFANLKQMKKLWDAYSGDEAESIAEIALVMDPESVLYLDDKNPDIRKFNNHIRNELSRVPAPFDVFSFRDIPKVDFDRYKLVIFPTQFEITPEKQEILDRFILNRRRTIFWLYSAGVNDGQTTNLNLTLENSGVAFKTPGLNYATKGKCRTCYLYEPLEVSTAMLREIAQSAGVHLYCQANLPVFANRRLLALHSAEAMTQQIQLPAPCKRVIDLYRNEVIAENCSSFSVKFNAPDTFLFEICE